MTVSRASRPLADPSAWPQGPLQADEPLRFDGIADALAAIRNGEMVVVVDDENRENEGDLICAAQFATPQQINFMATEARGLICLALEGERLDALDLPLMVDRNTDDNQTAFTVSVDAGPENGVSTGISAEDRARTIQVAIHPESRPADLRRPGHIFPLRARDGGVLKRAGHTEAAVDLARLAGLYPAGVICEIQNSDGSMARLPQLVCYARLHGLRMISIADLIRYRLNTERFVKRQAEAAMPSSFGVFRAVGYRNELDGSEHVAIVKGHPEQASTAVLVRVHSECLTGDAFGSLRCDCRPQLEAALRMIEQAGEGVVVYLRQEGRGIGLVNKLRAYSLQDTGLDTVEANERLGFAPDLRNYGVGAQILSDLGVHRLRLITNNPRKIAGLGGYGLTIEDRVPLVMDAGEHNAAYLRAKRVKLGHLMETGPSCLLSAMAVVGWQSAAATTDTSISQPGIQDLEAVSTARNLLIEREEDPRLRALLNLPHTLVRISSASSQEPISGTSLLELLVWIAGLSFTTSVGMLLAPDGQKGLHSPTDLTVEHRSLDELRSGELQNLSLDRARLLHWS